MCKHRPPFERRGTGLQKARRKPVVWRTGRSTKPSLARGRTNAGAGRSFQLKSRCPNVLQHSGFLTPYKQKKIRAQRARIFLVPMVGLEPTRCCHQRILSPHRLPFRHTGVRIAFILYYAAFVKSSVFCPQNAKKTISGLFSARRRAGLCRRGALPVSAVQRDSRRGLPVSAAQRDSRRGLPVPAAQRDSRRGLPQQASHC